jgi:hypothetical protein
MKKINEAVSQYQHSKNCSSGKLKIAAVGECKDVVNLGMAMTVSCNLNTLIIQLSWP